MNKELVNPTELINQLKEGKKAQTRIKGAKIEQKVLKSATELTKSAGSGYIKRTLNTVDTTKRNILKPKTLFNGVQLSQSSLSTTAQKELLRKILIKNGVNEESVADTMQKLRRNKDFRAKIAYIDRAVKYLGYDYEAPQASQGTNNTNIVIMPPDIIKKYRDSNNINTLGDDIISVD